MKIGQKWPENEMPARPTSRSDGQECKVIFSRTLKSLIRIRFVHCFLYGFVLFINLFHKPAAAGRQNIFVKIPFMAGQKVLGI
ncbi:MAG: hypothetical protein GY941_24750 [Planctomycetes bacterium]|nr:hypothetical protein [Planctomycetota bacterium]